MEDLITGELNRLVNEGIPAQEIEAALLTMEFSQREIRRSGGPFSLVWMRRSLRTWLHGCKPWESLLIEPAIKKIKENLLKDNRYFESLIKKYLLDNTHRALVTIEPKEDFLPKQEEQLSKTLSDMEKTLSENDRQQIKEKSKTLDDIQSEDNSPEALASIPHLSRSDLSVQNERINRNHVDLRGVPALCHDLYTNGITYIDMAFPVDILPVNDYPWLQFFSRAVTSVGLPGMDYGEVSSLLARTVGGFFTLLETGSIPKDTPSHLQTASGKFDLTGRDWIIYRVKCLDEKIVPSLELALRLITEADFTDHRRINDLVLEMKTRINSSLAPMGHMYASGRAGRGNSHARRINEKWNGISQIEFVHYLAALDTSEVVKKLRQIRDTILRAGLIANITGGSLDTASSSSVCAEFAQRFSRFGPPVPRPCSADIEKSPVLNSSNGSEVFASPALQVGFAALSLNAAPFNTIEQTAEIVLTHQLSTGALWEDIRMKGGAYGAFVNSDSLENSMSFATYRDPNPVRSLDIFSSIIKSGSSRDFLRKHCDEDNLVKSIIGCYAKETRPQTSSEKGFVDFLRFLYGIEESYRINKLERLISVSAADIANSFASLGSRVQSGTVIITGMKEAEKTAKALGTEVKLLPC